MKHIIEETETYNYLIKQRAKKTNTRPCLIKGEQFYFHKWIDKDDLLLAFKCTRRPEKQMELLKFYNNTGVIPPELSVEKIQKTFGLVESTNGEMKEVEPDSIRFTDIYD